METFSCKTGKFFTIFAKLLHGNGVLGHAKKVLFFLIFPFHVFMWTATKVSFVKCWCINPTANLTSNPKHIICNNINGGLLWETESNGGTAKSLTLLSDIFFLCLSLIMWVSQLVIVFMTLLLCFYYLTHFELNYTNKLERLRLFPHVPVSMCSNTLQVGGSKNY